MKRLAVLRHAKSSWDDAGLDDFERPLNDRGWKAAWRMGQEQEERGFSADFVIASPADRVRETLDGVRKHFRFAVPIRFEPTIYLASESRLLSLVRELPDETEAPLLVGHNPGLERLLATLARDDARGLRDRIEGKYPTGALAIVELPVERWIDVQPQCGEIVELILPKELDQAELD